MDLDSSRICLVAPQEAGRFVCRLDDETFYLAHGDGQPLAVRSVPRGSWPICYAVDREQAYLYFTYFLSSVIHKWRVDGEGRRLHGEGVGEAERRQLSALLLARFGEDQKVRWIAGKASAYLDLSEHAANKPPDDFIRAERETLDLFAAGGATGFLNWVAILPAPETNEALARIVRYHAVPDGYHDDITIRAGASTYSTGLVRDALNTFDLAEVARVARTVLEQIRDCQCYASARYRFAGYKPFPATHWVEVSYHPPDPRDATGQAFIDIALSAELLRRQLPAVDRERICNRLKLSIAGIFPYILPKLGADFAGPDRPLQFCFSDDGHGGVLSFDVPAGTETCILPDLYILRDPTPARYAQGSHFEDFLAGYRRKQPILFWRGSTTGSPIRSREEAVLNRRIVACRFMKHELGDMADAKISMIVQHSPELAQEIEEYLRQEGILAVPVPEARFGESQMYFDIAGNVAAWGTFRKFAMGCLVLRPEPQRELAYYRHLEAGVHYIKIRSDLSDLSERVGWALSHQEQAAAIAYTGRQAMLGFLKALDQHVTEACETWLRRRYGHDRHPQGEGAR